MSYALITNVGVAVQKMYGPLHAAWAEREGVKPAIVRWAEVEELQDNDQAKHRGYRLLTIGVEEPGYEDLSIYETYLPPIQ